MWLRIMETGWIFDIKRMSVNDGPGIRTTVFLKGCPMRCLWCHNPESQHAGVELASTAANESATAVLATIGDFNQRPISARNEATAAEAVKACPAGALDVIGSQRSVPEVVDAVLPDRPFFKRSGGGVTLSGGEPLAQADFCVVLLKAFREQGIHTLLDTCGAVAPAHLRLSLEYTDLYHYDLKATRDADHRRFTGLPLRPVLDNLALLNEGGARVVLRCPVIPGFNDDAEHLRELGCLAEQTAGVECVEILPYHDIGVHKYARLGRTAPPQPEKAPAADTIDGWRLIVAENTRKPVVVS